ncbi:hypothetical protein B0920_10200 [Massilia sp. KIM]|uniref:Kelch repeat-containing protein n=1 Tax=Massilia sp. KIM TaxID=1955422 RepID=UPI00098F506D|nr:hypothetical protein [Massilia sp. KIM]OON63698.1 hypothetical protein B0920_10200 [Massilia sp. KIM]
MFRYFILGAVLVSNTAFAQPNAPAPRANWAVARAGDQVYTFYGLGPGKTHADIARDVHALDLKNGRWRRVGEIPVPEGRLAAAALTVGGKVYLIGGYTVSPRGEEVSTPEILRFLPSSGGFEQESRMPVPVDDSVALPWRERWIVLVSGWHDKGNVADVQIYDTETRQWLRATPYPGTPVFGHAGGLVGDTLVVCDGVSAAKGADGKNVFAMADECWQGKLDPQQPASIVWQRLPAHPGPPLYRAGAVGDAGRILFAGGSPRAYNYNGIGYDKLPAQPSDAVFSFDPARGLWQSHAPLPEAGMDFRGLIPLGGQEYGLFGGMRAGQQVSAGVIRFRLHGAR